LLCRRLLPNPIALGSGIGTPQGPTRSGDHKHALVARVTDDDAWGVLLPAFGKYDAPLARRPELVTSTSVQTLAFHSSTTGYPGQSAVFRHEGVPVHVECSYYLVCLPALERHRSLAALHIMLVFAKRTKKHKFGTHGRPMIMLIALGHGLDTWKLLQDSADLQTKGERCNEVHRPADLQAFAR